METISYFKYIAKNENFATSKTFCNTVILFIINKATISNKNLEIKAGESQDIKIKSKGKNWSLLKQTKNATRCNDTVVTLAMIYSTLASFWKCQYYRI